MICLLILIKQHWKVATQKREFSGQFCYDSISFLLNLTHNHININLTSNLSFKSTMTMTIPSSEIDLKFISPPSETSPLQSKLNQESFNVSPSEEDIINSATNIWHEDPRTELLGISKLLTIIKVRHPNWTLSANRLKNCLKNAGLFATQVDSPISDNKLTTPQPVISSEIPGIDITVITGNNAKILHTKAKGKGLHATKTIEKGALIWSEIPLFTTVPLHKVRITRQSIACSHCGMAFQAREEVPKHARGPAGMTSCEHKDCKARYCDETCRKLDMGFAHAAMWHTSSSHSKIKSKTWSKFEKFCARNGLASTYAFGSVLLSLVKNSEQADIFQALSRCPRDEGEEKAFTLLKEVVSKVHDLRYEEFTHGIGAFQMNAFDESMIFAGHSHLNHSCEPNVRAEYDSITHQLNVYALDTISVNEELRVAYINTELDWEERQETLLRTWGFSCTCNKCKKERKEMAVVEVDCNTGFIMPPPTSERSRRKSVHFDDTNMAIQLVS